MDFVVLHFTLFVLLASILTSAVCLSAYLVSRRQLFLLGAVGFFFYFFDVAWVFQDNIVGFGHMWHDQLYLAVRSIATIVSGVGFMSTFWLVICEYLGHSSLKMRVIPCLVFTAVSIIALIVPLPEDDNLARFIFYTPRAVFLAWMLLYAGARYVFTRDDFERKRIARAKWIYLVLWALGAGMVIEDAAFFLGPNPTGFIMDLRAVAPERNYSENALMLCCMLVACRSALISLSLRFENPPQRQTEQQEDFVEAHLPLYAKRHRLSPREQEVLRMVLGGMDNQNIASALSLSLSTVKVHIHNILRKTGCRDRQELRQDYWTDA